MHIRQFRNGRSFWKRRNQLSEVCSAIELLEDRRLLAVTVGTPTWQNDGPAPVYALAPTQLGGNQPARSNQIDRFASEFAGAVQAIATPTGANGNADIIYAGATNGGVWVTSNATYSTTDGIDNDGDFEVDEADERVHWSPITDTQPSLAISDIAFSQAGPTVVYAATGSLSNFADLGGMPVGIYQILTNFGDTNPIVNLLGQDTFGLKPVEDEQGNPLFDRNQNPYVLAQRVRRIVPTAVADDGSVLLAATDAFYDHRGNKINPTAAANRLLGISRSTDGGQTWTHLTGNSGLPGGAATDLIADPSNANTFYAAFPNIGVYKSVDGGANWARQPLDVGNTTTIRMAIHHSTAGNPPVATNVVYAGLVRRGAAANPARNGLAAVAFSTDGGTNWTNMTTPRDRSGPLHNQQGDKNFAIVASPNDPNLVYVGGATQIVANRNGCVWPGRHFAGNRQNGAWSGLECTSFTAHTGTVSGATLDQAQQNTVLTINPGLNTTPNYYANWLLTRETIPAPPTNVFSEQASVTSSVALQDGSVQLVLNGKFIFTPNNGDRISLDRIPGRVTGQATTTTFNADASPGNFNFANGEYNGTTLQFQSNTATVALRNQRRTVTGFTFGDGVVAGITVNPPLPVAPSFNDTFLLTGAELTNAHADSRAMVFDANGNLLEGNDGGVYRLTNLHNVRTRQWLPLNTNLSTGEFVSVAWDPVTDVILGGTQDNGTPQQIRTNGPWKDVTGGDGMQTRVVSAPDGQSSYRYTSSQTFGGFKAQHFDSTNRLLSTTYIALRHGNGTARNSPTLKTTDSLPFTPVWELNAAQPHRMLIGTNGDRQRQFVGRLYESVNGGNNVFLRAQGIGQPTAMAFGAQAVVNGQLTNVPDVAVVGTQTPQFNDNRQFIGFTPGLYIRQAGAAPDGFVNIPNWQGGVPQDIVFDPHNWTRVWIVDDRGAVWRTTNAGAATADITFTNVTGNLADLGGTSLKTIVIHPGSSNANDEALMVGGLTGVYATGNPEADTPAWVRFGAELPRVSVRDLEYNTTDNLLLAGTLGRGVWTIRDVSGAFGTAAPVVTNPEFIPDEPIPDEPFPEEPIPDEPAWLNDFEQGGGPQPALTSNPAELSLTDTDSANLRSATVTIKNRPDGNNEILSAATDGTGITAQFDEETGTLNLSGDAPIETWNAVLLSVSYDNISAQPSPATRMVSVVVNDGDVNSNATLSAIEVELNGTAPLIDLNGPSVDGIDFESNYVENGLPLLIVDPALAITSPVSDNLVSATAFLQDSDLNPVTSDQEILTVDVTDTNIVAEYDPTNGQLDLSGMDSLANYEKVLRTLTYANQSDFFDDNLRLIDIVVDDGTEEGPLAFSDIFLLDLNDAPVLNPDVPYQLTEIFEDEPSILGDAPFEILFNPALDDPTEENLNAVLDSDDPLLELLPGIAIVGVDSTNGRWEYTRDFGDSWSPIEGVTESSALLLTGEVDSAIRFVPNEHFSGTIVDAISFRAWDQTTADPAVTFVKAGRRADTLDAGGTTAFSAEIATADLTVEPLNDAPQFVPGLNQLSPAGGTTAQTIHAWAGDIVNGGVDENDQVLSFEVVDNTNTELFATLPSIAADGTLSWTPAPGVTGTAVISFTLVDDGGTENGGEDRSETATVEITAVDSFDFDKSGDVNGNSDGILLLRAMAGFTGDALVQGVIDDASPLTPAEIETAVRLAADRLDVDLDHNIAPLTDGILFIRHLAGFSDDKLTNDAVHPDGLRTGSTDIGEYLNQFQVARQMSSASGQAAAMAFAPRSAANDSIGHRNNTNSPKPENQLQAAGSASDRMDDYSSGTTKAVLTHSVAVSPYPDGRSNSQADPPTDIDALFSMADLSDELDL